MRVVCTVWFLKHKYLRADVQVKELWTNCESSQALSTIQMTVYSLTSRTFLSLLVLPPNNNMC